MNRQLYTALMTASSTLALGASVAFAAPAVVTDIPVVDSLVRQVMGDVATPTLLLEPGASPHHYQLKPSQAGALNAADLVVMVGPELTPWLERALEGSDTAQLELLEAEGTHIRQFGAPHDPNHAHEAEDGHGHEAPKADDHAHDHAEDKHADEHADEHAGEAKAEEGHDHAHKGVDPHAWLDPLNADAWLGAIAQSLAEIDAENAETYRQNAESAKQRIRAMEAEIAHALEPFAGQSFVTFHGAYDYFTDHFGLGPAISIALGDAAPPSAARLSEVNTQLEAGGVACAFAEANHDPRAVEQVVERHNLRLGAPLDPAGASQEAGAGLYEAVIRNIGDSIATCMGAAKE